MSIVFKQDGMYSREWVYDDEKDLGQFVDTPVSFILPYLSCEVEAIEPGVTFRQFVSSFFCDQPHTDNVLLLNALADVSIEPYIIEMDKLPPKKDLEEDPLVSLEVYIHAEGHKWSKNDSHEMELYLGIHGQGTKVNEIMYAISYSHWGNFADLPVTFNPKTTMVMVTEKKKRKWYKPWGKKKRVYKYQSIPILYRPTLLKFIHDVLIDLCFCGSPEKRDGTMKELNRRMDEVNEGEVEYKKIDLDELLGDDDDD